MKDPKITDAVKVPSFVYCVDRQETGLHALRHMRTHSIHHLTVLDEGAVVGIVSDRDILARAELSGDAAWMDGIVISDVMAPLNHGLSEQATLREAVHEMWKQSCSAMPITLGNELIGIVTETDVVRVLAKAMKRESSLLDASGRMNAALGNVVVQSALQLLGEAGI